MSRTVLIIDDDVNVLASVELLLSREGYRVLGFTGWNDGAKAAAADGCSLALLDMYLGQERGADVLVELLEENPLVPVILLSGQAGPEEAVAGVRAGAFDFIEKPFSPERLLLSAANAARFHDLRSRVAGAALPVRESPAMARLSAQAARYAASGAPVLISGESGTGKDLMAGLVHALSRRSDAPLVKINCGAIAKTLADSELFGHARGAFTGADRDYEGRIAPADGGTLFLDEVGELPPDAQVKLLRFLETGELQRVGDSRLRRVDVRVVAATNRDLLEACRDGAFREDLYFRLNVLSLHVPPLRDRKDDVVPLALWFIGAAAARDGLKAPQLSEGARDELLAYAFPGNARELRNVAERLVCSAGGGILEAADVRDALGSAGRAAPAREAGADGTLEALLSRDMPLPEAREALEREYLGRSLERHGGSVKATAEALGVLPNNLSRRLGQLGLGPGRPRPGQ